MLAHKNFSSSFLVADDRYRYRRSSLPALINLHCLST